MPSTQQDLITDSSPEQSNITSKVQDFCANNKRDIDKEVITSAPELSPLSKISDTDKLALDLAKEKKITAEAQLQTAQARLQAADLAYRFVILQLYHKYHLEMSDRLSEDGNITYAEKEST